MPISSLKLSLTKDAAELASMALGREDDDRLTRGNRTHCGNGNVKDSRRLLPESRQGNTHSTTHRALELHTVSTL